MARKNNSHANLTPEANYWVRDPQSRWYSVTQEDASFVFGAPKGNYAKLGKWRRRKKEIEVALLAAMPLSYTSKSDVERGLGIVLWDWALGPKECWRIHDKIRQLTGDDIRREELAGRPIPSYAKSFLALGEQLCGEPPTRPNPSTAAAKQRCMR